MIKRFIDQDAQIIYVPTDQVFATAEREGAIAFDIPNAPISHVGEYCSFDTFLHRFGIDDPSLLALALIVRVQIRIGMRWRRRRQVCMR